MVVIVVIVRMLGNCMIIRSLDKRTPPPHFAETLVTLGSPVESLEILQKGLLKPHSSQDCHFLCLRDWNSADDGQHGGLAFSIAWG